MKQQRLTTNAEVMKYNKRQEQRSRSGDEEGAISLLDDLSKSEMENRHKGMNKFIRSQEAMPVNLQRKVNQGRRDQHNGNEVSPYRHLDHKESSSPIGDETDQSGYKEVQVAEYNQDESGGEPNVIDMTEDEIGMDAHDAVVIETGQQKFFDNTDQINSEPADNIQTSVASTRIIAAKDLKNRGQLAATEYSPSKNLKDTIA